MKNLSRRDFIKGTLGGAAALAAGGVFAAYGVQSSAAADGIYTPGTYTATAEGMGLVTMTATFDANSILDIDLDVSNETAAIGQAAKEELVKQLLEAQSNEIDGVSGATMTTNAAKACLASCIAQAKGLAVVAEEKGEAVATDGSFVATDLVPEDINASAVVMEEITDFAEEIKCDVVVCGAGTSGVVAAVAAAEEGKKVVVLQKEAFADSQGNCASGIIKSGCTERGIKRWMTLCSAFNSWRSKPELLQAYVDNSEAAINLLLERGGLNEENNYTNEKTGVSVYQWSYTGEYTGVWKDGTQSYDLGDEKVEIKAPWFGPKPNNMGTLVQGILADAVEEYGDKLDVHFSTPVVQLLMKDGAVVGCVGKNADGKYIKVSAKAVILATGAYENNETMVRRFCPDIEEFDKKVYHRTGDGNILAILAGGVMEPVAHSRVMHDFDAGLLWDEPTFLNVNMNGERFIDENIEMAYISNPLRYQPKFKGENMDHNHDETGSRGWYCQIYGENWMDYTVTKIPPQVQSKYLVEGDPETHVSVFPHLIDTFRADTLEELAEQLGIPADNLKASVARYNELCEAGNDDDFGKDAAYMHKFETAPFWGIRRHIRCSSVTAGVETDANSRVVTQDGVVIPGLYAVGNLGGKFFGAPDYPFFQGGLSLGHAATFGYIAGKHAATL